MDFEYSDEQRQLADSVRKYLANEYDFEARKAIIKSPTGISDKAWATFAELGLTAIPFAEADGGFGGGAVDLMAAMGLTPRGLLREKGTPYDELGLADPKWTDAQLIGHMLAHPILINRPIVETPLGVRLCRPSEVVAEILPEGSLGEFIKEDRERVSKPKGEPS